MKVAKPFSKGYGLANAEHNVPIEPTTVFHVASVSKQFTAMAIAILAHEGKLSWTMSSEICA